MGALAVAACGDKSSTGSSTPSASTGSTASSGATTGTTGTTASGTPVLVGLINDESGVLAFPELTTGANAAVSYVNSHGGVNGHPLQIVHCAADGTDAGALSCANTMISKKVVAVVPGQLTGVDSIVKPLESAGIPIFAESAQGQTAPTDPKVTYLSTSQGLTDAGVFKFFKQISVKTPFLTAPDLGPQLKTLVESVLIPAAKADSLTLTYNLYNAASPDFASVVTAAKKNNSDAIFIVADESGCTNLIKTAQQLGYKGILFGGSCVQYVKALGAQAAGVYSLSFLVPPTAIATSPADQKADVQQYIDQMKAAGAESSTNSVYAETGYSSMSTLAAALTGVTGDITAATATPAITGFKGRVFAGAPVDCTARPSPGGTCGHEFVALQTKADGTQTVVGGAYIDAATP